MNKKAAVEKCRNVPISCPANVNKYLTFDTFFCAVTSLSYFFSHSYLSGLLLHWLARKGNINTTLGLTSHNEIFEKCISARPNDMQTVSILCFPCQISDASLQRLRSITLPRGLFLSATISQVHPRCAHCISSNPSSFSWLLLVRA